MLRHLTAQVHPGAGGKPTGFAELRLGPGAEPKPFKDKICAAVETEVPRQHRRGSARFEATHEFRMRPKAHVLSH